MDCVLQALDVTILNNTADMQDAVMALINSLPLQVGPSATLFKPACQILVMTVSLM